MQAESGPEPSREIITYDEALKRAGGFGLYQIILYLTGAIIAVLGD